MSGAHGMTGSIVFTTAAAVVATALTLASPASASVPTAPPTFTTPLSITNTYFPFVENAVKVFRGKSDGERTVVVDFYKSETRDFTWGAGTVPTHILQETEFADGRIVEISYNHFAQADDGSVYYFGEVVDIYENDLVVAHDGSWLVGGATLPSDPPGTANAADPTVFMPGNPEVNDQFKPEDLFPLVDETVTVLALDKKLKTEAGKFKNVMKVKETSLIPDSDPEKKWYAPDVGVIRAQGKGEVLELIAYFV